MKGDYKEALRNLGGRLAKFKYPLLILLLGIVLLAIPTKGETAQETEAAEETAWEPTHHGDTLQDLEVQMETILSEMQGAGRVQVMLQYATGEKTVYQTDSRQEVYTGDGERETTTEVSTAFSSSGGQQTPVVVQVMEPTFRGALVVAEGAGNPTVKLDLVNAVSSLTGLGADKITVIKMKSK